jgi:hypothetical protein
LAFSWYWHTMTRQLPSILLVDLASRLQISNTDNCTKFRHKLSKTLVSFNKTIEVPTQSCSIETFTLICTTALGYMWVNLNKETLRS